MHLQLNLMTFPAPHPLAAAGPYGTWKGGREKAPAAFCRKALTAVDEVEMWGDGKQTRSFTFIDDCVEGILRITKSDFRQPLNLGSCEMVRDSCVCVCVCVPSDSAAQLCMAGCPVMQCTCAAAVNISVRPPHHPMTPARPLPPACPPGVDEWHDGDGDGL